MGSPEPRKADAIHAALNSDWENAIEINLLLTKSDPENTDTLNRLGFAYSKIGKTDEARKVFEKVLALDKFNQIAQRHLKKLTDHDTDCGQTTGSVSPMRFIEEPGLTLTIPCVNVAPDRVLSHVSSGQEVVLVVKKRTIEVRDQRKTYLGALPDDISFKLIKFLTGGNTYLTVIQHIGKNCLSVLVRELTRGKQFRNQPSFTGSY